MHKIITQIRDIELIEKELNTNPVGVLAVVSENERTIQKTVTFLYLDKNIYLLFKNDDEFYENLQFNALVSFTIVKNDKSRKLPKMDFTPVYDVFSISIAGILKKVDEQKLINEVKENFLKKYSKKSESGKKALSALGEVVIIDTEEIHAFEEIGG